MSLALAVAPHVATLARHGTLDYLADGDDVFYLSIARIPYHGEFWLRDPFVSRSERIPTLHAWVMFVPLSVVARLLGTTMLGIALVWRIVGGCALGGVLYLVFRRLYAGTRNPVAWTVGCALICLADDGFIGGRTLVADFGYLGQMLRGMQPIRNLQGLAQYRVVTPLLNLPIMLLTVACLLPKPTRGLRHILLATGALGLCFLMYFFYWTAAVIALGGYIVTLLVAGWVSPAMRAERWMTARAAGAVLTGGVLLGIPQVAINARTFNTPENQPILERLSRGRHLPAGSPLRAVYLKNAWAISKIAIGAAAVLALRLHGLGLLWWLTAAGFLLSNSALVTGLEFENYHWSYVYSPAGEILILGVVVLSIARSARPEERWLSWLWVMPAVLVVIALAWRPYHALTAPESVENSRVLGSLRPLQPALANLGEDRVLAGPRETAIALLFTRCAILYQFPYTAHSSLITDREVHERHALNAWLQGMELADYDRIAGLDVFQVGPADEPSWRPAAIGRTRKEVFRQIQEDPNPFLERYRPDTLLLPANAPGPDRAGPWRLLQRSAAWSLWSKQSIKR